VPNDAEAETLTAAAHALLAVYDATAGAGAPSAHRAAGAGPAPFLTRAKRAARRRLRR
jgi:hypothetical protein